MTGDLTVTAQYEYNGLAVLSEMIGESGDRTRPAYTATIAEWDTYWSVFQAALTHAGQVYNNLKDKSNPTEAEVSEIDSAIANLQRQKEILDGIEDFDAALGDREEPLGLVETVYERSLQTGSFQPHRLRCYYDRENSKLYWLMSSYLQGQDYLNGSTGTGMNPGLQNVMLSESIIRLQSSGTSVEIYHSDGTRKTKKELENEGIDLAIYWIFNEGLLDTSTYADFVGFEIDCQLVGRTSDGTEFERTYAFKFLDAGVYRFDPNFRYCVVDDVVQRKPEDFKVFNATQGVKYTDGSIQDAINAANPGDTLYVARGNHNESIIIDKSITVLGDFGDIYAAGTGPTPPVLDGTDLSGAPGILVTAGNATIRGFEIKDFDSGGIVVQGAGASNVTIESNYIHGVGSGAVIGNIEGAQGLTTWSVSKNIIEDFTGSGLNIENVSGLSIDKNIIRNPVSGSGVAIEVTNRADNSSANMSSVTITNNEISGFSAGAVKVASTAQGALSATAENVTISNNEFTGGAVNIVSQANEASSSATIDDVNISGNTISGSYTALDVCQLGSGTAKLQSFTITGNNFTVNDPREDGYAIKLADVEGESSFSNNKITIDGNIGSGGSAFDGVEISGAATGKWSINGNEFDGSNVVTASSGIRLRSSLPATATLTLSENTITQWAQGIKSEALAEGTKVELRRNWIFDNNGYGILNGNGEVIDAALNYWGHTSGPYHAEQNDDGQGNQVSDKVNFFPWYQDEDFQSVSDGTVHNVTQDKYYHSIQTAVDEAAPGDVINVAPGVYSEEVIIKKSITLIGDPGNPGEPGPGPNAPILDGSNLPSPFTNCGFQIRYADNVVIEGFEIRNYQYQGLDLYSSANNVTFSYNHVHDVAGEGVRAYANTNAYGWKVSNNIFEKVATGQFAFYGIWFMNVSQSEISNNFILNHSPGMEVAINVGAEKNVGQDPVSGITIKNNTITGSAKCLGFSSDNSPDKSALRDITIENNILKTTGAMALEGAAQISGAAVLKDNTIEVKEGEMGLQLWFWNDRTVEWTIENNVFTGINGKSYNAAIMYWIGTGTPSVAFYMEGNTFTGWDKGILSYSPTTDATLRSNRFMGNSWAIVNFSSQIDARNNYWGHESGPYHESLNPDGQGEGISDNVIFDPWYIDEDCTILSDEAGGQ